MLSLRTLRLATIKNYVRCISAKAQYVNDTVDKFNLEIRNGGIIPPFKLAALFENRLAIQDQSGEITYRGLFEAAKELSTDISRTLNGNNQKTVAYLCPGDASHLFTLWAIWMTGNIAIPLSPQHPPALINYYLKDSGASLVICDPSLKEILSDVKAPVLQIPHNIKSHALLHNVIESHDVYSEEAKEEPIEVNPIDLSGFLDGKFYADSDAIILYTSGTTSNPKGVVHGFKQLAYQISSLHDSWRYRANDTLLHCLPLNHIHGLVASACAGLAAGAKIRMMTSFHPSAVWAHFLGMKKRDHSRITVFMGVPTMYVKLLEEYDRVFVSEKHKEYVKSVLLNRMRLMISGSAPLPNAVFQKWFDVTGHRLLERYGMTEIGLALSNPYDPSCDRKAGSVGTPLPGITAKIGDLATLEAPPVKLEINLSQIHFNPDKEETSKNLFDAEPSNSFDKEYKLTYLKEVDKKAPIQGELYIKGPAVMRRYWEKPEQTKAEFTEDGWFKTGDSVVYDHGRMKIIGRTSVDIIKSGGYKVSALDVEAAIFGHPSIADATVIGLPDPTWGEKVTAVVQLKEGAALTLSELQEFGAEFIPKYQLPTSIYLIEKIPRNALGKVNKKELRGSIEKKFQTK